MLVDDHELVRTALKHLLTEIKGLKIVAEASTGEDALKLAREKNPDIVLMDIKMPGIGGLEATRKLLRFNPDMKVVVLTSCENEPFPSRFLQAGAMGFITKAAGQDELLNAVRGVMAGQRYISPRIAQSLVLNQMSENQGAPFDLLSDRELQVMMMITKGGKVSEISEKLCLSTKTVNSYRYRIFDKLNINSDVELTHLALRHGMLDGIPEEATAE